ncbi:MAG: hypothetical protein KatS3mg044_0402 [Rhodothermaceae bacterium]|nr:MAG: hypothetical protein KatS3mg044_0402 [Rhodothermaceae bacterium]
MPEKTWKAVERKVAERLGGRRVPVTGRSRGDAPDVAHAWLSIEIKHRARLPAWIEDAMRCGDAGNRTRVRTAADTDVYVRSRPIGVSPASCAGRRGQMQAKADWVSSLGLSRCPYDQST